MEYEECAILRSLKIPRDRIHRTVVMCGSPYRFAIFAEFGSNYREFGDFFCYKAAEIEVEGQMILIICHGVGGSAAAPIVRELIEMGTRVLIRSGTCGTYKPSIYKAGDLCICYATIREDTSSRSEVDVRYPGVADLDVVDGLADAAEKLGFSASMVRAYCSDHIYHKTCKEEHRRVFAINGVADVEENELAPIFVLASLYGAKAGAILTVDGSPLEWGIGKHFVETDTDKTGRRKMAQVALTAASELSRKFCS